MRNSIVFEWDMDDNFKAGDSVTIAKFKNNGQLTGYNTLQSARYCDIMGRADLFLFRMFNKQDWTFEQAQRLPLVDSKSLVPTEEKSAFFLSSKKAVVLDKDNREALSFNYQINLLEEDVTFITYSNLFVEKKGRLKMCFLKNPVAYLDETTELSNTTIIVDNVDYEVVPENNALRLTILGEKHDGVKAIVLYEQDGQVKIPCIVRNIDRCKDIFSDWYIYPILN